MSGLGPFGSCHHCLGANQPSAGDCYACLLAATDESAFSRCPVCGGDKDERYPTCATDLCRSPLMRQFRSNYTVVIADERLYSGILACKQGPHRIWGPVLARVLAGYLDAHAELMAFDPIIAAPAYEGARGTGYSHAAWLLNEAVKLATGPWVFSVDFDALVLKSQPTERMSDHNTATERDALAKLLREALQLAPEAVVRSRRVLVVDDVLTRGNTLNETARVLKRAGATEVCGLSLVRKNKVPGTPDRVEEASS